MAIIMAQQIAQEI